MVEALLVLTRSGDVELQIQRFDMDVLVREVIASISEADPAAPLPRVTGRLPEIVADPVLARQVLVNLIGNALKFTSEVPQPRIELGLFGATDQALFFVRDNGIGFDANDAHQLSNRFTAFTVRALRARVWVCPSSGESLTATVARSGLTALPVSAPPSTSVSAGQRSPGKLTCKPESRFLARPNLNSSNCDMLDIHPVVSAPPKR